MLEYNNFAQLDEEFTSERAQGPGSTHKRRKNKQDNKTKKKETMRERIFKIFYIITKERNTDKGTACFLILVLFIQMFDLLISPIMKLPFKGLLYGELSDIFDVIRIYPAVVRAGNIQIYYGFLIGILISTFFYLIMVIIVDFSLRNHKFQVLWPIRMLQRLSTFYFWILVIPVTDFFISVYECEDGYQAIDTSLECFGTKHAFLIAIFSLGLMLFFIISIAISLLFNEARPYHTDALTRLDTNLEVYLTVYRIILTVVSHYTTKNNYHWIVMALHFLVCCHLINNYQKYLPYYISIVSSVYGACCLGYMWVILNSALIKALEQIQYEGQIIVILIGFIFIFPAAAFIRQNRVLKILMSISQEKVKSDLELDQFVTNFQDFIQLQEQNEEFEMLFIGFLYMHREECQSAGCPLKSNDNLFLPLNEQTSKRDIFPSKDKILHQHFVNSMFQDYQKAHAIILRHANVLTSTMHTSYAQFLFFQMGNVHMALIELNLAQKCPTTIQQSFTIFKTKHIIEEFLIKRFRQGTKSGNQFIGAGQISLQAYAELDVTIVITFENLFTRLEKAIEQSATDHIEFWSHLDSNMIDLNVINKLGLNIINQTKKVNEIWKQLIKINPTYPNALYIYGNYLQQIKNDIEQGEEYKTQYLQVKRLKSLDDYENQFDLMFAEDTTVIIMNGQKEQQGKIIKTNQGIFKLFGYSMFEVQGHDVSILMPPVIALKHQGFLEKYFRTGKERILNNCLESFAMYRTGTIFPIHLVVKPVPSLKNDIQYIGMIKRSGRDYEYILTDENGKIDSISDGITSLLKLPISFFKEHDIPIQVIVPELCEVCRMRTTNGNGIEIATNFDQWNGVRDLRFIIPKNFSSSSSRVGATSTGMKADITSEDINSGTGTGTGTGTQTSSSSKNMKHLHGLLAPTQQQTFIGLRSPESLKSISNMFKNAEHKGQPDKYKNNLLNHVNYQNPDFDKTLKTDILTKIYSDGDLKVKVFKIYFSKKKKNQLGRRYSGESSQDRGQGKDEETMLHKFGFSGMSALNDKYTFQKYKELIANAKNLDKNFNYKKLQHDIDVLKMLLERQKKIRTQGNIMTPAEYEHAELERMIKNIQQLEQQISDMNTGDSRTSKNPNGGTGGLQIDGTSSQGGIKSNSYQNSFMGKMFTNQKGTEESNSYNNSKGGVQPNIFASAGQGSKEQNSKGSKGSHHLSIFGAPALQDKRAPQPDEDENSKENSEDKQGDDEDDQTKNEPYDENLDEDSKSIEKVKKKKKKDNNGDEITAGTGSRAKKTKEDPRRDFVNDFFMQNLNNNNTNLVVPTQQNRQQMAQKLREQQKQAYQVDLQNELLRNLHDEKSRSRQQKRRDDTSSFPTSTQDKDKKGDTSNESDKAAVTTDLDLKNESSSVKMQVDDTGSVTSDTKTLMRHLRVLRNALYENYAPQSIQNLKHSARFVLVVLIAMTIASFIFSKQKYDQLKENFYNIQSSQQRMHSITSINTATRFANLINNGTLNRYRYGTGQDYMQKMKDDLNTQAVLLQQAQTFLTQTDFDFSDANKYIINADNITLYYNVPEEVGNTQDVNIWTAVMQVAITAYKAKDLNLTQFVDSDMSIWFILKNCMNNILSAVTRSTQGILDDTKTLSNENKEILMILLLVASGCLLASMIIIMPVVTKVHKDKDKLLSLFLQIDQNDVKEQLKRCKDFFSTFHNDDKGGAQHGDAGFDFDDDEKKEGEEQKEGEAKDGKDGKTPSSDEIKKKEEQKEQTHTQQRNRFTRKSKKLKKYSTNYIMLLLKFFVVITLMESYFLYQYFQSDNFLQRSLDMIKEAAVIANRSFSNFLLYQVIIEIIATNGTAMVFNQKSTEYIVNYLDQFNVELENFLQVHSDNVKKHDDDFNNFFDSLIYQSVCQTIDSYFTAEQRTECPTYLGGVLEKGLYSANLAFWDDMREIRDSFFKSDRSQKFLKTLINSDRLIQDEKLNEIYFSMAYQILMEKQNESITVQFDNRNKEIVILFAIYLVLLVALYFILWGRFVESTRHSLWVTKSMLAIIPLEVIEKVKQIKDFLMSTSRAAMRSLKE